MSHNWCRPSSDARLRIDHGSRRQSEKDAYTLLRQTAMSQNKRMFDVAEAIISMVDIFKP